MTMLVEDLQTFQPPPTVVYVGNQMKFAQGSHIPRYLLGDYVNMSLPDPAQLDSTLEKQLFDAQLGAQPCVALVARPAQLAALQVLERQHPSGQLAPIKWPQTGNLLFYRYSVGCSYSVIN
jgi:hypothetical protein